ncbi:hypothetical protein Hanom_Chr06g00578141 [Helianthus anomalus]
MTLRSIGPVALCIKPLTTLSLSLAVWFSAVNKKEEIIHHNRNTIIFCLGNSLKSSMHLKEIVVYWDLISCFFNHFISVEEIRSRKLMLPSGLDYFHIHVSYSLLSLLVIVMIFI